MKMDETGGHVRLCTGKIISILSRYLGSHAMAVFSAFFSLENEPRMSNKVQSISIFSTVCHIRFRSCHRFLKNISSNGIILFEMACRKHAFKLNNLLFYIGGFFMSNSNFYSSSK